MGRFYFMLVLIAIITSLHFILLYRRFKKEGDSFKLHNHHSWKRLEDYLPYLLIGIGVNAIDDTPVETYLIEAGLSHLLITIIEISFSVLISLIALFGFNIYLKRNGWKKPKDQEQNI